MAPIGGGSDRDLVLAFQAGGKDAYDEVFRRHHDRVIRLCSRMLGNSQDAEEAAQETFLKAYQALARFNGNFQLGAWLSRIATNVCLDHLRVRSRSHLVALPPDEQIREPESGPEELVVGGHPRLDLAMEQVQPAHARALTLRAIGGLSHREIANRLKISPAQAKALLHRARHSIRKAWDKAEGWVVAPIISLRSVFQRSEPTATANVSSIAPQVPFLVEKVAASAVIVVVALGGIHNIHSNSLTEGDGATTSGGSSVRWSSSAPSRQRPAAKATRPEVEKSVEDTDPLELVATIKATIRKPDRRKGDGRDRDKNDGTIKRSAHAAAESTGRLVEEAVAEAQDQLEDPL